MKKIYRFPLERTHCGVPMGNGNAGVLVWGENALHLTVNRSDFWDHFGGDFLKGENFYQQLIKCAEESNYSRKALSDMFMACYDPDRLWINPKRLPVGRFEVFFKDGAVPEGAELDYTTGILAVKLSNGKTLLLELPLGADLLQVVDSENTIAEIKCRPYDEFPRANNYLKDHKFPAPERFANGWIVKCLCPDDKPLTCAWEKREDKYFFTIGCDVPADLDCKIAQTRKFWSDLFASIPEFTLPEKNWNDFYKFCAWKLAAATAPTGYAAGLQGPWIEEYQNAQWGGDYHFNVNVQMVYDGALKLGHPELLMPLFDMIESDAFTATLRYNSKILFNDDSAWYFTHAVDDRGVQIGGLGCGSVLDPVCGAWTAMLYIGYVDMTGDEEFLKNRAYNAVRKIMRGFELMLDKDLNIPLAISAEYASSNPDSLPAGRNPSYQLAGMRYLADTLIKWSIRLGIEPEPIWQQILDKVPKFSTITGRDRYGARAPEQHIAIWENQDLVHCHRHHSHLATIYPFPDPQPYTEDELKILDDSIDHWISLGSGMWSEWCMMWAIQIYSRLNFSEVPMIMLNLWKEHFVNESDCIVYLPRFRGLICHRRHDMVLDKRDHEIMQLDGVGGYISVFTEMFCCYEHDKVYLFRGIPAKWRKEAAFKGVKLPGGWSVSADSSSVTIEGTAGKTLTVVIDGKEFVLTAGTHKTA